MKLRDFKGVFKTQTVEFISAENVKDDYYIINIQKPKELTWRPGEHGIFSMPNNKVEGKKWRAFSIASIPNEDVILLGTRTGRDMSSFKRNLINMKKGDKIKLRGPFGWFTIQDETSPLVMIALGVGITPIRALLKEVEHKKDRIVDLLYSADYFLFKEDIDEIIDHKESFNVDYESSVQGTKIKIVEKAVEFGNDAYYYVSGPQEVIKAVQKQLIENGIEKKRIIFDPFLGY